MVSQESLAYYQELLKRPAFGAEGFDFVGLRQWGAERRELTEFAVFTALVDIDGLPAEWVWTEGADPGVRLLYLHGGGFVSASGGCYLPLAARLSKAAGCAVLLPDYRLAPENRFPAALEDCIRAFTWMLAAGPGGPALARSAFIAGDSAGGGLTLSTLLARRDRKLRLPEAAIAISAFADLTLSGRSIQSQAAIDPIMSPKCLPYFVDYYLGGADPRQPLASPAFGDYRGLPPLLFQVGEHEIILDDTLAAAAKAQSDGVSVTLEVWEGMFHVFQSHEPPLPEARQAIAHIADFAKANLKKP
jgi:acetyl esterase/lipase